MRLRLLAVALVIGVCAQFFRNAHVVVAPDIMRDLGASAASLATLTSAMFLASAITHLPGGILLDRYGPRRMVPVMLLLSGIGAGLFGMADSVGGLTFARAFMGAGGSVLVMAGVVCCSRWFEARHFSSLAGGIMATSQLGNLGSTVPMALLAGWFGWRGAYMFLLGFTVVLAVVAYASVRDAPPGHAYHSREPEPLARAAGGVAEVLRIPGIWRLMVMSWCAYASVLCVSGLWGGPWLSDVLGLDTLGRGKVLFWMAAGLMAGSYGFTLLDRWLHRTRTLIAAGAMATAAVFVVLALIPVPALWQAAFLLGVLGLAGGFNVLTITHARRFVPDRLIGRGLAVINTAMLLGVASLQLGSGLLAGWLSTPGERMHADVYRTIFAVLAAILVGAVLVYRRCPEGSPGQPVGATVVGATRASIGRAGAGD